MNRKIQVTSQAVLIVVTVLISYGLASHSALSRNVGVPHPGDLDPTFGNDGRVITPVSFVHGPDYGKAVALQIDGKVIVAGSSNSRVSQDLDFALARYNPDGSLDASFGSGGKVITPIGNVYDNIYALAIQADGKIIAAGTALYYGQGQFVLVRYNSDGSLDTSFDVDGKVLANVSVLGGQAHAVALQSDGKILIAGVGSFSTGGGNISQDFVLMRYHTDGSLDTGFGSAGKVITSMSGGEDYGEAVAVQIDGKIVVAGTILTGSYSFAIARYNLNGTLDTTFGTGGRVITSVRGAVSAMFLQIDSKIVVAGDLDFTVARFNNDGSLDVTFGSGGIVTTQVGNAQALALQNDGKIVASGFGGPYSNRYFVLTRYNANGSLDTGFGTGGVVNLQIGTREDIANGVVVQNDGRIVAAGFASGLRYLEFAVARLTPSGLPDATFGDDGIVTTQIGSDYGGEDNAYAVATQNDGKIVVAGDSDYASDFSLTRHNSDGSLDTSFGAGGKVITDLGSDADYARALALQSDGRIVVAGTSFQGETREDFAVVQYNADGSLDLTFGSGGKVITPFTGSSDDVVRSVAIQSDGKIVVAGSSYRNFALARYNTDGSIDSRFGINGKVMTPIGIGNNEIFSVKLQNDGKILAAGYRISGGQAGLDFALARYNLNGSLDPSFGIGGTVVTDFGSAEDTINSVAIQSDGRIVAAGTSTFFSNRDFALARYNPNGSLDSNFGGGGTLITRISNRDDIAAAVALQSDGKIIAAGTSGYQSGLDDFALVRYTVSGVLDAGFGAGGKAVTSFGSGQDEAHAVAIQSDGKIVATGRTRNGQDHDFALARYDGGASSIPTFRKAFDFDGDGKADISVVRPAEATWYIQPSSGIGLRAQQWGLPTDKLVPGDYDADDKTDITVFRDGVWYRLNSSNNTFVAIQFGQAGDVLVPADYDGDYKTDLAVYRQGTWYIQQSSSGFAVVQFGGQTDKPVAADYDGDGKADPAVFRDGTWYTLRSTAGSAAVQFGLSTDRPVPADYDGDGKTDFAVYRDGTWYVLGSSSGFQGIPFRITTDIPVPADYDGDSKADIAVFSNGVWYMLRSSDGRFVTQNFGSIGDVAVPSVYVP